MIPKNFLLSKLRDPVIAGITRVERWRRLQLDTFEAMLDKHQSEILDALNSDLGKPSTEAIFEIIALKQELSLTKKQLSKWMRPKKIKVPLPLQPAEASVQLEPLGCILIIGPWNYPFSLTLQPLISALAAGNSAVLKPSEKAPETSKLIAKIIPEYFSNDVIKVIEGDGEVAKALIDKGFDHIFFTGGCAIGQEVMRLAANHLTPVTLELGGQSPAIVATGADITTTAKRLIWGKSLNAGQTCIAPNHLLVQKELKEPLINEAKKTIAEFN